MARIPALDVTRLADDLTRLADEYKADCFVAVAESGSTLFSKAFGNTGERFALDSAGGLLLGLAVMLLHQDQLIYPDDPVVRYAPDWADVLPAGLTVTELLRQTSCLPDPLRRLTLTELHNGAENAGLSEDALLAREREFYLAGREPSRQLENLSSCTDAEAPCFAPSSVDESLLCRLITNITGGSPAQLIAQRILSPLGIECRLSGGAFWLTAVELEGLLAALARRELISASGWLLAEDVAAPHSIPFARQGGFLCGHSVLSGYTTEIMLHRQPGTAMLIASPRLMPWLQKEGAFRQFDIDAAGCLNAQLIYPAHTRMEPLSLRNISAALAIDSSCDDRGYTASPAADLARSAASRSRQTFVATEGGAAVGLLSLSTDTERKYARLETVLVDSRFRRRGFGRIMVRWAMRHLREKGVQSVFLCVDRSNTPALAMYERLGFEAWAVYEHAYIMKAEL